MKNKFLLLYFIKNLLFSNEIESDIVCLQHYFVSFYPKRKKNIIYN